MMREFEWQANELGRSPDSNWKLFVTRKIEKFH